jgi:hypothetical protein
MEAGAVRHPGELGRPRRSRWQVSSYQYYHNFAAGMRQGIFLRDGPFGKHFGRLNPVRPGSAMIAHKRGS